ncbi:glutamate-5-semialdehyde dehydrogenase [Streptomyces chryseus]|uniref:Gamma-glutamyl phosphate reductase n=1 Tax=Streptomyces chryseus TaxID=68186 RepID=A0ABQ3E6K5_9ACTN|nr:glutamate-5-semialdehyde dehydrogenase [Streptomyces chryseus]GHB27636.1 hypothetical protein GCM10010346_58880 [Streptomyces chryseus]
MVAASDRPFADIPMSPAMVGLHYGQVVFEGLKAYRREHGAVAVFRPVDHAARLRRSATRLAIPPLPEETFLKAVDLLVSADQECLPDEPGLSLYLRPLLFASEANLALRPARSYTFLLIAFVNGGFFSDRPEPVTVFISRDYTRATPGGTGNVKFAGNYAPAYPAQEQARQAGCHQVVWLDPVERRWVEELGGMNLFFVRGSGPTAELLAPPAVGTLLPGVTRDSLLRLSGRLGLTVREEPVSVEQWKALSVTVTEVCPRAREASTVVRELTTEAKDRVLAEMADAVDGAAERLRKANALDVEAAREAGTSATLTDRLTLTDKRIAGMTSAIRTIIDLQDPVGQVVKGSTRPNGIHIDQVREPLGVVAVIYEARPNVTVEVAALCLKSGNSAVLRGSSIAMHTNVAIPEVLTDVLRRSGDVPDDAVQLIRDPSREAALELLHADEYVDLLVPRGGPGLIKTVRDNATVPTVIDGDGNCHVYVDATADLAMATDIVVNGKTSRPSVCNACAEGKHDKESDKNHATFVSYHGRGSRSRNNAGPVRGARLPGRRARRARRVRMCHRQRGHIVGPRRDTGLSGQQRQDLSGRGYVEDLLPGGGWARATGTAWPGTSRGERRATPTAISDRSSARTSGARERRGRSSTTSSLPRRRCGVCTSLGQACNERSHSDKRYTVGRPDGVAQTACAAATIDVRRFPHERVDDGPVGPLGGATVRVVHGGDQVIAGQARRGRGRPGPHASLAPSWPRRRTPMPRCTRFAAVEPVGAVRIDESISLHSVRRKRPAGRSANFT